MCISRPKAARAASFLMNMLMKMGAAEAKENGRSLIKIVNPLLYTQHFFQPCISRAAYRKLGAAIKQHQVIFFLIRLNTGD